MVEYLVSPQAVVLGLEEKECAERENLVRLCLEERGMKLWDGMESEIFLSAGESLLIARPRKPKLSRVGASIPRLRRL